MRPERSIIEALTLDPVAVETFRKITTSLGVIAHELPYPPVVSPPYKTFMSQRLNVRKKDLALVAGYFQDAVLVNDPVFVLFEKEGDAETLWMSDTPMEKESHMAHIACAEGNVVICGLGMGMVLYNIIMRPNVEKVIVVDKNKFLVNAFKKFAQYELWPKPFREKVQFVIADVTKDALDNLPPIDFMYCDTWDTLYWEHAMRIVQCCYHTLLRDQKPRYVGMWGQELEFVKFCADKGRELSAEMWEAFKEETTIPFRIADGITMEQYFTTCKLATALLYLQHEHAK